jgi:hypothetical protein
MGGIIATEDFSALMVIFAPDADAQSALRSASRLLEGNPPRSASAPAAYK